MIRTASDGSTRSVEVSVAAERLVGEAYGRTFALEGPVDVVEAVRPSLPFGWRPTTGAPDRTWQVTPSDDGFRATADDVLVVSGGGAADVARLVAQDLELWVAETAEGLVFVHAGVVVVDGRAVVIPGSSRAGKSTLVAALVQQGADYYSDEFAPIDTSGRVHAYRRSPNQRPDSPAAAWSLPPLPTSPAPAVPIGLVAAVRWAADADLTLTPMAHAAALMPLLSNTVCALTRSVEALDTLTVATADALRVEGIRGDAEVAARALLEHLGRRALTA